ncbi:ras-related protein Rab-32 [Ambystoma mexicanum]|uniref:ras-related protein Rab-32 n=1 Tax=Ambystoma mexicanum TaxID=8296 RepID=UPI0037E7CFED
MSGSGSGDEAAGTPQLPERSEYLFKVLVIGELGVGKTSIIKRYVHQLFSQHYRATIGVDFALKVISWDSRTMVRLQLWDIAGQERFGNMTRVYYKEAVGAFVVFDVTRGSTFEAVMKWKQDLDSKVYLPNGNPIPTILLANKCDQAKETHYQSPSQMDTFCKENGFVGWFETSAKDNINIDEASRSLVENILANCKTFPTEKHDDDHVQLGHTNLAPAESKSQCC